MWPTTRRSGAPFAADDRAVLRLVVIEFERAERRTARSDESEGRHMEPLDGLDPLTVDPQKLPPD
jgi:hypothetical protein